jgi:hypothetical protein
VLPTIARWLEIAAQFQRALNSLMSVKYAEQMFAENRLLNATYGAEAFHRLTQNERYMAGAVIRCPVRHPVSGAHQPAGAGNPRHRQRVRRRPQMSDFLQTRSLHVCVFRWTTKMVVRSIAKLSK